MNLKQLAAMSLVVAATSAHASLIVSSSTGVNANSGITTESFLSPYVLIFSPTSNGTVSALGLFDNGGDGFAGYSHGFTVSLWANTGGNDGTQLASVTFNPSTPGTSAGIGNEWRTQSVGSISLNASTSYALVVRDANNSGASLFSGYGAGTHGAGDFDVSGVTATYSGITLTGAYTRSSFTGSGTGLFDTTGYTTETSTRYRVVTADFTAVPEPSTYALVAGVGMIGFGLWRRRSVKA